jgi:hypothetical protein
VFPLLLLWWGMKKIFCKRHFLTTRKGKIDHLNRGFLLLPRHSQVRRSSTWERASLSPVLSHYCHLVLRSWGRYLGTSSYSHPARITLINFFLPICFVIQEPGSPLPAEGL